MRRGIITCCKTVYPVNSLKKEKRYVVMEKAKKKGLTIKAVILLIVIVVAVITSGTMAGMAVVLNMEGLEERTIEMLEVAAKDLKEHYERDIKVGAGLENGWVRYDTNYVDHLKNEGIELTLFKADTRYVTSILDKNGARIEGTKASDAVIEAVINKGEDFVDSGVEIQGTPYYVYYCPVEDGTGNVVGMAFAGITADAVHKIVYGAADSFVILAVALLIIFTIVAYFLSIRIGKPFSKVAVAIDRVADGHLDVNIDAATNVRETLTLMDAAHKLVSQLGDIIGKTKGVSNKLAQDSQNINELSKTSAEGTSQIAVAISDLAKGAESLADNVSNINVQAINIGRSIEGIGENAESLISTSDRIRKANDEAREYIDKVSQSSGKSVDAVASIQRQIEETNEAVEKIKKAVEMISSIASQTNLLALNASIEAARAGEAGRGFAVVASEIGNLSEQSNASANDIKQVVSDIVEKSDESVRVSTEVAALIKEEQGYIQETQGKFTVLNQEIDESVAGINEISSKIGALEEAKNTIISSVSDLSAISQENAASNEEVSASISGIVDAVSTIAKNSEENYSGAVELNKTVDYFK